MQPVKVLYDHQTFSLQDFGGVSLIYSELLRYYATIPERIKASAFAPLSGNVNLQVAQPQLSWHLLHKIANPLRFKLQFHLDRLLTIPVMKMGNFDVFHSTYYNPYFLPYINKPWVLTVNDMSHEVFAHDPAFRPEVRKQKELLANKATKVIVITEFVKKDLMKIYNIPGEKIEVIHLGGDNILRPENQDACNFAAILPKKYIVYDGTRKTEYKNFRPYLTAIAPLLKKDSDLFFVCAGGVPFTENEKQFFDQLGITKKMIHIQIQGDIPMQAVFWKNATLFAYPSLYEGFGIPLVQAMFCDCPMVGSNSGSIPEVGGDVAFYFDGRNQESMHEITEKALYDQEERKKRIALGRLRAKEFTWEKTAEKTLALYESIR